MEFIILAVVVALFNAWIAGKMGRSAFLWFIISIFLGVVATIVLVILAIVDKGNNRKGKVFSDLYDAQTFVNAYYSDLPVSLRCSLAQQVFDEAKTRDHAHDICLTEADRLFERNRKYVDQPFK